MKQVLLGSARPANALYQHRKPHMIPKNPPDLHRGLLGIPWASRRRYPSPSRRRAISAHRNREKNARVDLRVQRVMTTQKMNQHW